ncbi:RdgB/HAM1 family non-canonical purine NTP pyrophosphatase [Gorillibacterium sp. CAU 1737]|uniref:RdgB/HAM1 family non-canonical purine NTP pyrophosphatase n=1 Tax=Gorillibacterium sp. CAU 1737 TaxID=3140362 RepID=UPI00325FF192
MGFGEGNEERAGDSSNRVIVVATRNKGKIGEFAAMFGELGFTVRSLLDYAEAIDVVEDQDTFLGNALKKAKETAERLQVPVLADDSGLEVDALAGAPGVYSARYAGEPTDDAANNDKLLRELARQGTPERLAAGAASEEAVFVYSAARFVSVLVLYNPADGSWLHAEGTCRGYILSERRGEGGFGYDPLFYLPEFGKTLAEMTMADKNKVSHRGHALGTLREKLAAENG